MDLHIFYVENLFFRDILMDNQVKSAENQSKE